MSVPFNCLLKWHCCLCPKATDKMRENKGTTTKNKPLYWSFWCSVTLCWLAASEMNVSTTKKENVISAMIKTQVTCHL